MKSFEPLTDSVFYIMASLTEPRHGYAVMSFVEETTEGAFVIGPASLYSIIKKLLKEQLIVLHDESNTRRKVYKLTEIGRQTLAVDIARRKVMIRMAETGLERGDT
ncbi:PadR family transcriptional regulator [Sporosarcina sp. P18a]|uniref:PadR family transcriptional regulator n=1 Tax=Sporosarcina sp. P18a TaxID=2048259 RepID=UPI000C172AB6|nr:PadR family transcriptional regulator [Sporosarcina sp. P18a]PIC80764.1 PadR family transcriptional regulator [Sporosarcina sp. P18a]